jgi:hypothetical protein
MPAAMLHAHSSGAVAAASRTDGWCASLLGSQLRCMVRPDTCSNHSIMQLSVPARDQQQHSIRPRQAMPCHAMHSGPGSLH